MNGDDTIDEAAGVLMNGAAAMSRAAEVLLRKRQEQKSREAGVEQRRAEELQARYEAQARAAEAFYGRTVDPAWMRLASAEDAAQAWRGAHQWAQVDPQRFEPLADRMNTTLTTARGVDARAELAGAGVRLEDAQSTLTGLLERASTERTQDRDQGEDQAREQARDGGATQAADEASAAVQVDQAEADYDSAERRSSTAAALRTAGVSDEAIAAKMTADHLNGHDPRRVVANTRDGARRARSIGRPRAKTVEQTQDLGPSR